MGTPSSDDLHTQLNPEFYSDVQAVDLPELSWHDVESLAGDSEEPAPEAPTEEQTEEQTAQRETAEYHYQARQRFFAELDEQLERVVADDSPFAVSPSMEPALVAFRSVVNSFIVRRSRSVIGVARYKDDGHATHRAFKPTNTDFYSDVELVAERALKLAPEHRAIFKKTILEELGESWDAVPAKKKYKIEKQVGRAFPKPGCIR